MRLLPTVAQEEIVGTVRMFLSKEMPLTRLREFDDGRNPLGDHFWKQCAEQGWFGLGLPEETGGVGGSVVEEVLLFREIGRAVTPGPFLPAVLGARVATHAAAAELAAEILSGDAVVALGELRDPDASVGETVSGRLDLFYGDAAQYVLVLDEATAALVRRADLPAGEHVSCIDSTIAFERLEARGVPTVAVVETGVDALRARGTLLSAALLAGIAEAARDRTSDYANVRMQFGRPIGVNQAVKHECADMAVRADAATYQTFFAAVVHHAGREDLEFHVSAAKIVAAESAIRNAESAVQLHGAMGFTFEHFAHRYVSRARVYERLFDSSTQLLDRLIRLPAPR